MTSSSCCRGITADGGTIRFGLDATCRVSNAVPTEFAPNATARQCANTGAIAQLAGVPE